MCVEKIRHLNYIFSYMIVTEVYEILMNVYKISMYVYWMAKHKT